MFDIVIRDGLVVDGSGAPARRADVAIAGDRVVEITPLDRGGVSGRGHREVDADERIVTPGFVDVHTRLIKGMPSDEWRARHGVTSAVVCGHGDEPGSADGLRSGINVGTLVDHDALRTAAMGERGLGDAPAGPDDLAEMCRLLDQAILDGALGVSTGRSLMPRTTADGQPGGGFTTSDELLTLAGVLGGRGVGVFESAIVLDGNDDDDLTASRAELAWLGAASRLSGRPVSVGLAQHIDRPDRHRDVIALVREQHSDGAHVRPRTEARAVGSLFGLDGGTPFDRAPAWRELRAAPPGRRLPMLRDTTMCQRLILDADVHGSAVDPTTLYVVSPEGRSGADADPPRTLAAVAAERGVSAAAAFIELLLESQGTLVCSQPVLNPHADAVERLLDDPLVVLGLPVTGGRFDPGPLIAQSTFLLDDWVAGRGRGTLEEAVRRLTTEPASLFGIRGRGRLVEGAAADLNVIALDGLVLHRAEYVAGLLGGEGGYVEWASGFELTLVNGAPFMEHGEPTGSRSGRPVCNR